MLLWTLQSNAADVLSLGPRTAGQLQRVGVQSVEQLLAARPQVVAQRLADERITAQVIADWQREAQLVLAAPQLSPNAARILAAAGFGSLEKVARSTPTELLAALELLFKEEKRASGPKNFSLPSVTDLSHWIRSACEALADRAA